MTWHATMPWLLLASALAGGEREQGLRLYQEGRYAEAAAAFRAAIAADGDSAELQCNLALACLYAGDLAAAETAAEKYAALATDARVDLHAGMLGAVRYEQARASARAALPPSAEGQDAMTGLEQALQQAKDARDHFVRAAAANPTPERQRNLERALRLVRAIEQRLEQLRQQKQQQEQEQQQEQTQQQQQPGEPPDQKPPEQSGQPQSGQPPQPEPQSEPEPKTAPEPAPPAGAESAGGARPPAPAPSTGSRGDAPGEHGEGRELTPEQTQRLLELLQKLEQQQRAIRARAKSGRPPVERDW